MTGLFDLSGWPSGMRLIVRNERPHPGAQLRINDYDGHRITAFVTNTSRGQLATSSCGTAAGRAPRTASRRRRAPDPVRQRMATGQTGEPASTASRNSAAEPAEPRS